MAALDPIPGPGEPSPKKVMVRIDKLIPSDLRLLDDSCLIRYLQSIPLPIGATPVDVYEIEPGAKTQWIVAKHFDVLKIFIRDGEALLENQFRSSRRGEEKNCAAVSSIKICVPVHVGCVRGKIIPHQTVGQQTRVSNRSITGFL